MNKTTIFYALVFVLICFVLLIIESIDRDNIQTEPSQEYNETLKCMKWDGIITSTEYIKNESGMHLTYNNTESFVLTREQIEYFDMSSEFSIIAIQEHRENCTRASFHTSLHEYSLNDIDFDIHITVHYDENVRYVLSHSKIDMVEFESDMCLEYIKVYDKIN